MNFLPRTAQIGGLMTAATMIAVIPHEYGGGPVFAALAGSFVLLAVAFFSISAPMSRRAFVILGLGLFVWAVLTRSDWAEGTARAITQGSFIIALFTALMAIRSVAVNSTEIIECGRFLARQPPGLRYFALTIGGHLFGLILLYGSISLLGSLAAESTALEADEERRRHRLRRMLVAIQRGFAATLCWSPLALSMAVTMANVPGATWSGAVLFCLVSAAIMVLLGWLLDTIFKPRLATPPPVRPAETGRWLPHLRPLIILLAVIVAAVIVMRRLAGVEVVGAVMSLVPLVALIWIAILPSPGPDGPLSRAGRWAAGFALRDLAGYRGEVILLFMAAFIGSMGSFLLVPLMAEHGPDLMRVPPLLLVATLVWIIPLTGQLGMNPILSVSLLVPLLPTPEMLGLSPAAMVVAITGGWALSGNTSPFTASVLLVGGLGKVAPRYAGMVWNGPYALTTGVALTIWTLIVAALT